MAVHKVRWEEMFPDELDAALAGCPLAYLTYGPCEPHGLHNALGLDEFKAHGVAVAAAQAHGGIVVPPYFWHVHEIGIEARWAHETIGDRNPWLTDIPPWLFFKNYWYHLRATAARGFHAAIVLTGHAPYARDLQRISDIFMQHSPLRIWAGGDGDAIDDPDYSSGHAGRLETSLLWALRPDLVDMSRLAQGSTEEIIRVMATGADAGEASRRLGEELVAVHVEWLGRKAAELLDAYRPRSQPAHPTPGNPLGALTFDQTEQLWREEIEPILAELDCMGLPSGHQPVDPNSPWAPNERTRLF